MAGESIVEAAERRLWEEMGISAELNSIYSFIYHATFDNGLTEHEYDHVLVGNSDALPIINMEEVSEYRYISLENLMAEMEREPQLFSVWLRICFAAVKEQILASKRIKIT